MVGPAATGLSDFCVVLFACTYLPTHHDGLLLALSAVSPDACLYPSWQRRAAVGCSEILRPARMGADVECISVLIQFYFGILLPVGTRIPILCWSTPASDTYGHRDRAGWQHSVYMQGASPLR